MSRVARLPRAHVAAALVLLLATLVGMGWAVRTLSAPGVNWRAVFAGVVLATGWDVVSSFVRGVVRGWRRAAAERGL